MTPPLAETLLIETERARPDGPVRTTDGRPSDSAIDGSQTSAPALRAIPRAGHSASAGRDDALISVVATAERPQEPAEHHAPRQRRLATSGPVVHCFVPSATYQVSEHGIHRCYEKGRTRNARAPRSADLVVAPCMARGCRGTTARASQVDLGVTTTSDLDPRGRADDPGLLTPAETGLLMDQYELVMTASYLRRGRDEPATFELSVRDLPPGRRWLLAAGLRRP